MHSYVKGNEMIHLAAVTDFNESDEPTELRFIWKPSSPRTKFMHFKGAFGAASAAEMHDSPHSHYYYKMLHSHQDLGSPDTKHSRDQHGAWEGVVPEGECAFRQQSPGQVQGQREILSGQGRQGHQMFRPYDLNWKDTTRSPLSMGSVRRRPWGA